MARKEITQFDAAASVATTDYVLLQPGPTGTDYVYAPVSMVLRGVSSALASGPSYDDDAAAAAGGIAVGQMYRNGNFLMVRLT